MQRLTKSLDESALCKRTRRTSFSKKGQQALPLEGHRFRDVSTKKQKARNSCQLVGIPLIESPKNTQSSLSSRTMIDPSSGEVVSGEWGVGHGAVGPKFLPQQRKMLISVKLDGFRVPLVLGPEGRGSGGRV